MVIDADQGLTLLAGANPVPDPDKTDSDTHAGEPVSQPSTGISERKRSAAPWLVAAGVVVVLGTMLVLNAREPSTPAATPSTNVESLDEWILIPHEIEDGSSKGIILETGTRGGTYRTADFKSGFSFTIPDGWHKNRDYVFWAVLGPLAPPGSDNSETLGGTTQGSIVFRSFGPAPPDWVVANIRGADGVEATEPVDVVIGGAPGQTFEISAVNNPVTVGNEADEEGFGITIPLGPATPVYVLRVAYETVLIYIEHPAAGGDFIDEARAVLDTIEWRDLN